MHPTRLLLVITLLLAGVGHADVDAGVPTAPEPTGDGAAVGPVDAGVPPAEVAPPPPPARRRPSPSPPSPPPEVTPPPPPAPLPVVGGRSWPVLVDDVATPLSFSVPSQGREARVRAADAAAAFAAALETEALPDARPAQVVLRDAVAIVKVQGRAVATLTLADAEAAGAPSLPAWAEEQETRLVEFVTTWQRRRALQSLAFHIFFSITLIVLAALTLRGLNRAMARADAAVEDRAGTIQPLVLFGVPVLSSDTARGLLATGLIVGRVLGVVVVVLATVGGVLAQFDATRPLLERVLAAVAQPIVRGLEALAAAVPGVVLAAVLVVLLRGGLRFLRLLLDGVAAGRVKSGLVRPRRVPVTRVVATVAIVLLALPLIIAAAFGRFGTPFETLALVAGGVILLSTLPLLASAAVGVVLVWRGTLTAGDWVEVDGQVGEVASIGLTELVVVPARGGTVSVPMLMLAVRPLRRLARQPELEHLVRIERREKATVLIERLTAIARSVDPDGGAEIIDADAETALVRLFVPLGKSDAHNALSRALLNAVDEGVVALASGRSSR
jgi:hypothetical protein